MHGRIGVFGGTFDPPHVGHLAAAAEVRHVLGLAEVLLVVAHDPWQKSGAAAITPAADRLAMVEAATHDIEGLVASDLEIARGGASYTVDTLRTLSSRGADELFLVLGRDAAAGIETWHQPDALRSLAVPVVVSRHGEDRALPAGWPWREVAVPALAVSSTDVRARVAAGRPIDGQVPPAVVAVLEARRLYRDRP